MRKLLLAGAAFAALASPAYATDWSNLMKGDGDTPQCLQRGNSPASEFNT